MRFAVSAFLALVMAAAAVPAGAAVTYTLSFSGADLRDYTQADPLTGDTPVVGTLAGGFVLTTANFISAASTLIPGSCSVTETPSLGLYACNPAGQEFDPDGFGTGFDLISFQTVNTDSSGGGGGFLFFADGAFGAVGTYEIFTGAITDGNGGSFGNFAPTGTLVVSSVQVNDVPEPATLALFGLGLAGVAAARRRR